MEEEHESFFDKNGVALGVGIGFLLALGTGLAYLGYQKEKNRQSRPVSTVPSLNTSQQVRRVAAAPTQFVQQPLRNPAPPKPISYASDSQEYHNLMNVLVNLVQQYTASGELQMNTLMIMHDALMELAQHDYVKIVTQSRKDRRAVREKDPGHYLSLIHI